ncbi:MAG: hypothetical protein JWN23_1660 [Rhodocyclales bacterium]|nr:hypothetical protein [Rhodocyclales bacterium]
MKIPHLVLLSLVLSASGIALAQQSAPVGERPMHREMMDRLKAADTNKDGMISREEAEKSLPMLAKHFDEIDTNKDGKISPDELKATGEKMRHHHDGMGPFAGADANHDRVITRDEILQHNQQVLQDFDAADTNKDGKLSRDEMKAWHEKMHAQRQQRGDAPPPAK